MSSCAPARSRRTRRFASRRSASEGIAPGRSSASSIRDVSSEILRRFSSRGKVYRIDGCLHFCKLRPMLSSMQARTEGGNRLDSQAVGILFDTLVTAIEAAEKRGETRYQIAKRTGVSQATLSRIANRQTESVSLDTLEKLIDALGIEIRLKKR